MAQSNNINFKLNFEIGDNQAFNKLKSQLNEVKALASNVEFGSPQVIQSTIKTANTLEQALSRAYNPTLNTVNIQKFNNILKQSGLNVTTLQTNLANAGAVGQQAFLNATTQLMKFNTATMQTNKFLTSISESLFNTLKYSAFNAIINSISGTVQHAYGYVKSLDSSLNDIRIVTGKSADEMERFAKEANDAAKSLAVTTEDYTQGSLIYYQQGLDDETVKTLTDITAKTSNVTQQSMSTVSEQLTAVLNGYQVANQAAEEGMQVYEEYVDKMAAVGATTASNLEELSTAMSKVASAASAMGVDFDDLNAQIATIVSVTRQAPESVGTALKTIYARLGDLKVDGVDEFGTKLGEVSSQLQTMGINIIDQQGNMRNMSDVIAEVAQKLDTLTSAQREAAAVAMAGKRQYNNLIALFDNLDMYGKALETSMNAAGTLEKQQETALESLANKMDVLKATAEGLYGSLFDTDSISGLIDAGTKLLEILTDFSDGIGGLNSIVPMLLTSMTQLFSGQIANGISTIVNNLRIANEQEKLMAQNAEQLKLIFSDSTLVQSLNSQGTVGQIAGESFNQLKQFYTEMQQYQGIMTKEEKEQYGLILENISALGDKKVLLEQEETALQNNVNKLKLIDKELIKDKERIGELNNEAGKFKQIAENLTIQVKNFSGEVSNKKAAEAIRQVTKEFNLSDEQVIKLVQHYRDLKRETGSSQEAFKRLTDELKKLSTGITDIDKLRNAIEVLKGSVDNVGASFEQNLRTRLNIENIVKAVSAVGQFASALNTLKNIGNIFSNEDLSGGEKLFQILTNIGFVVPTLASSFKSFFGVIDKTTNIFSAATQAIEKNTAAKKLSKIADQEGLAVSELLSKATTKEALTKYLAEKAEKEYIATSGGAVVALSAETKAEIEEAAAKEAETIITQKATLEQEKLNITILKNPYIAAAAAIGILIAAIAALIISHKKAQEEAYKARVEEQQLYEERREAARAEINDTQELLKSYNELYAKYEKGIVTKEQLADKTEQLKDVLEEENIAVLELTGNYKDLNAAILEARRAKTQEKIEQNNNDIEENRNKLESNEAFNEMNNDFTISKESYDNLLSQLSEEEKKLIKSEEVGNGLVNFKIDLSQDYSGGDIAALVNTLQKEGYMNNNTLGEIVNYANNINAALKDNKLLDLEEKYFNQEIKSWDDYSSALEDITKELTENKALGMNESQALAQAMEILKTTQTGIDNYETRALATNSLVSKFGDQHATDIRQTLSQYSDSEVAAILDLDIKEEDLVDFKNNLDDILTQAAKEFGEKLSEETLTASSDVMTKIQTGKITKENAEKDESYKALMNNLDAITNAYPELNEEATILNQTWLIGTEEYINALEKVQDKMYEVSLNKSIDEANEKIDEFKERFSNLEFDESSVDAFKESMDEILNAQYEIDVKIHTEAEQEFDSISNAFDKMDTMASKIGEDFKVAAGDIRDLNNAFPGILDGMEYLKDGSVKLNKDVVEAAMAAAEAEAKADAEATLNKLQNQASLLRAKQKTYQKLANSALVLAKGEAATEEESAQARANINEELANLKEINSQEAASSEMNNAKEVADNSFINAQKTGENWVSAFKEMAESSLAAAKAAIQNMQTVANNGNGPLTGGDFSSVQYTGSGGETGDASIVGVTEAMLNGTGDTDLAEIAEKYAMLADSAGEAANDIEGMIMQLGAKSIALDKNLGSIAAGKGSTKSKSKSGGKDKDKDEKEWEDEFDRYWEIKKAIDAVDHSLSKLEKDKQNLYGYELIDALKQENELLEQQAANYNTLYEMQQQEAAELREQLGTMGLMFDASGAITNYAAATSAALQQYSAAIEQYNAGLIDETTLKVYEKSYENFKKLLERYDKLYYTEMQQTQEKLDEIRRKELANNLKAWEVEIQIHLDKEKMKRDWNDFLKDIKQDFRKVFSDLTIDVKYDEKNFKSLVNDVLTTTKAISDVEAEIDKMMAGGDSTMFESVSQAQEKLKELQEQLLDQGKALRELYKQVWETYLNGIDQVKDQFDELMNRYEKFNDELEFHRSLIELLYGDKAYDLMDKYYETQTKNIEAQIESLRKQADFLQSEFQKSYETAIKSGSKVDIDDFTTLTEDMKKAYENMTEAQGNLNDLILECVEILQKQYLNSINKIMDEMDKGIWGKDGFEGMKENWEFMQKMADEYLDAVEGAAKIQTFANKMDMDKANANSLKAQQKIQAFREKEIEALREKENLTQADIDLAEARYQIMLKEIALEDAQNNKTSMKLTRNEQGNLSYQYVADEDDVGQKQQDLLQSYSDLYKLADDSYNHAMELSFNLYEEYTEKLRALYEDTTLSEQERNEKIMALQDQYLPQIEAAAKNSELYKQEAMIASAGVFSEVCKQDKTAYKNLTDEQKALVDSVMDKNFDDYDEMRTAIINDYYPDLRRTAEEVFGDMNINSQTTAAQIIQEWATNPGSVKNEINKAVSSMQDAIKNYEKELDELQKKAGKNFSDIGGDIDKVSQKIDNMDGTTDKMVNNSSQYLDELRRVLNDVADAWNSVIDKILESQQEMQRYLDLMAAAKAASGANNGGGNGGGTNPGANPGGNGDNSNTGGGATKASYKIQDRMTGTIYYSGSGTLEEAKEMKKKFYPGAPGSFNIPPMAQLYGLLGGNTEFRSGGYTGKWNDDSGRLAMLHQKELVLNADDTENFLSGISMIRDMTSLNGSISNAITGAVANMMLTLGRTSVGTGFESPTAETATNNVFNITAEFPNANDVNEIRQAILSLPNLASQYIGKNIR